MTAPKRKAREWSHEVHLRVAGEAVKPKRKAREWTLWWSSQWKEYLVVTGWPCSCDSQDDLWDHIRVREVLPKRKKKKS